MLNVRQRMEQVLVFIKKEQELLKVQKKIQNDINERVEKNQRDYFLREELRSIQEELGTDAEGNASDYLKFKTKIEKIQNNKKMLINHIIKMRKKFCVAIQSYFRMYIIKKHFFSIFL